MSQIRRFLSFVLCFVLMLRGVPVRAQWSGSLDLSGGMGGMKGSLVSNDKPMFHSLAQGAFQLNYKTDQISWSSTLRGQWEKNTTDNSRITYKDGLVDITYKSATSKPLSVNLQSTLSWTPSPDRKYSAWIQYRQTHNPGINYHYTANADTEDLISFSFYQERPLLTNHSIETGLRTYRRFNSGHSILQSSLSFRSSGSRQDHTWSVFKMGEGENDDDGGTFLNLAESVQGYAWEYRITPSSRDYDLDGDIHLQMTLLDGPVQLKYAPGFRVSSKHTLDKNRGATHVNLTVDDEIEEVWRDSTRLREDFDYRSLQAEPYLTADFKWKSIEAHADYACQVYGRRLNDDAHRQPLKIKGVYPVGKANLKWVISPRHSINLIHQLGVSHPDYLKICWYDRSAGYLDQLYRGDENLISPETRRYGLEYDFKLNRFISKFSVTYTGVSNEIDQTWSDEEIDGRQYTVFRWLNASDSHSVGLAQKVGWQGKVITANAGITYSQSRRRAKTGDTVKDSYNWTLNGDIAARLGKGWRLGADAHYHSRVATFFTIFKEYCELNARVQKDFKRITLFLEGRDLLDQSRETGFESQGQESLWIENVRSNRRMVVLGAHWKF